MERLVSQRNQPAGLDGAKKPRFSWADCQDADVLYINGKQVRQTFTSTPNAVTVPAGAAQAGKNLL